MIPAGLVLALVLLGTGGAAFGSSAFELELRTPKDVAVVAINYLPVGNSLPATRIVRGDEHLRYRGGGKIDCEETRLCKESLSGRLRDLHNAAERTAEFMTEATRYHAYREAGAPPALRYRVVEHLTILQTRDDAGPRSWAAGPRGRLGYPVEGMIRGYLRGQDRRNGKYRHPTAYLFDTLNVCRLVKEQRVRMIFFSSYHSRNAVPAESFSAGPLGNIGNSGGDLGLYCRNGQVLPARERQRADATYHVIGYAPASGRFPTDNTIHNLGHHLEALFRYVDKSLWEKFVGPTGHIDRTKVYPGMPGVLPGQTFELDDVVRRFGIRIEVRGLGRDRRARIRVRAVRPLPDRPPFPGEQLPRQIGTNTDVTLESGETVALRGKDVQLKYWENDKKAKFTVYRPSADFAVVRRCGKTHYPPNAETDYDLRNRTFRVRTDCEDWTPDMSGTILAGITCQHWGGRTCNESPTDELAFQRWWQQSFPGLDNQVRWNQGGKTWQMRNLWAFLAEFHQAVRRRRALSFEVRHLASPPPTGLRAESSDGRVRLAWNPPGDRPVRGYNVFRSERREGPFERLNLEPSNDREWVDRAGLVKGTTFHYQVKAIGTTGVQSEHGTALAIEVRP